MRWPDWLRSAWPALCAGQYVRVPDELSIHALAVPRAAVRVGQLGDWTWSQPDGSRIHVQRFAGGLVAHRDRWDPSRGLLHAVAHVLRETPQGRAAGKIAVGLGIARIFLF